MKPICYGGTMSVISFFSTIAKIPFFANPTDETREFIRTTIRVLLALFVIVVFLSIRSGNNAKSLSKEFPLQFRLAARFRTPMLMFIVVPISYIRSLHVWFGDWYRRNMSDGPKDTHEDRVNYIVNQVKSWHRDGRKSVMRTARPNWASMSTKLSSNKGESRMIKTENLTHILNVDAENMTITAEPGVTMGRITNHLLPKGLALLIQVEMESITIGGVAMGFGMETNSHVSGFFQESVVAYELVTASGEVVQVDKDSDPELFYALPWSCGTIGFLVSVTVRLCKVKPYVHVRYLPVFSTDELGAKMKELAESPDAPYFLEATVYTKDKAVIQIGEFSEAPSDSKKINGINWWFKPFYYKWVETFLEKGESDEFIPLKHYYHRFTRSIFWELEDMIPFSNHWLYRVLWGWMGAPEVSLLKLFQGPAIRRASVYAHVVQESIMPIRYLSEGVDKFDNWYGVYPLLVFPLRVYDRKSLSGFLRPRKENLMKGKDYGIWVDLGAYGAPREVKEGRVWDAKANIREMEHWTRSIGGWQAYYTDLFCTRREFKQMFDHTLLDKCRKRLEALDAFPEVYDKVKPEDGIVDLNKEEAADKRATVSGKRK